MSPKLGLIAGNGRFPFLLLDAARAHGLTVVVAAIKEETDPEINERAAADARVRVHWLSLGELSKLIETFKAEGVSRAVMAGQVKHKQIFSSIRPDWRLAKLLMSLRTRNTDMLLGAVAKVLGDEGIELISSTAYLEPLLATAGTMTARGPDENELSDIEYGRRVAVGIAGFDLGQTVVVAAGACVAVEAMEGTDATIARAGELFRTLDEVGDDAAATTLRRALTVVKVAKPNQDMRFDVPVVGVATIEAMRAAGAMCLCVEAGRTLLFDRAAMVRAADEAGIAIVGRERGSSVEFIGRGVGWCYALCRHESHEFIPGKRNGMRKAVWSLMLAGAVAAGVIGAKAHAYAAADNPLQPGTVAPGFTLPSQTDAMVSLKDYKGKFVVLYFYPKDQTSGCTLEAHNFERDKEKYAAANAVVLGVSLDTVESHKAFCTKDGLNFKLLADPEHKVIDAYGVPIATMGPVSYAKRDTFLIGPDGKVLKMWEVKSIATHSDDVLAAIAEAKK